MKLGGIGNLMQILPIYPVSTSLLSLSMILMTNPGEGLVALPGLEGKVYKSMKLQEIIHPVSVYQ